MESTLLQQIRAIYRQYFDTVADIRARNRFSEGILGIGNVLQKDQCHIEFAKSIEQLIQSDAAQSTDAESAESVLRLLVDMAREYEGDRVLSPMLQAVQGYGCALVPCLSQSQAAALADWYGGVYPANQRLPAQKRLLTALRNAGRSSVAGRRGLSFFKQ